MIRSASLVTGAKRLAAAGALLGLVAVGTVAAPQPANAWWAHGYGWCCGVGIYVPPVVVAPPPVYAPAPAYYGPAPTYYAPGPAYSAPPQRAWIPGHWESGYWVNGHWS